MRSKNEVSQALPCLPANSYPAGYMAGYIPTGSQGSERMHSLSKIPTAKLPLTVLRDHLSQEPLPRFCSLAPAKGPVMEVLPHHGCVFRSCRVQLHIQILAEHVDSIERADDRERKLRKSGEASRHHCPTWQSPHILPKFFRKPGLIVPRIS